MEREMESAGESPTLSLNCSC